MAVLSNGRMSSVPKGAIGRTRKQREITMIDRPISQRQAYNEGRAKQMAAIAARKAPKASAPGRIKAGRQKSTIRNTTGQSKTLNNFNSRPAGTMVLGPGYKLVPSPTRVPLRVAGPGAKDSDQAFARVATKAARSRAAWAKRKAEAGAAKKPIGWMQSPEARKDRTDPMMAGHRKDHGRRLRALPKAARRAIQIERLARKQKFLVAGNTAAQLTNLSEGRMQLIANVGKRKNKLTPGQIDAITRSMSQSARRLKVGMATGNRGRMKYNPKALQLAPSTAARTIRGARVGGAGVMKGKPTGKAATIGREQFVGRQGSRTTSMGEAIAAASPGGRTRMSKKQEGRMIATAERQVSAIRAKDQKAGALYDALARAGRVKPPRAENRIARLTRAAQGDPNTERAKAAQRLLTKRAAKPAAPKRVTAGRLAGTVAKPRGLKPGALKASRIARGRAKRAAEPLGTRLNRVYIRVKAIEARNDPRTLRGKNTRRNDRSFGIARKASGFLGQGNKAWSDRARLSTGRRSAATSGLRPGRKITIKVKRTPKPTKQDKAFESVMNLKGVTDFSRGKQRQVWIDAKMMTRSRREKLGLSGRMMAESDRYYAREDVNPMTGMAGYFMGTRSGWFNSQPKTRQGVISSRPRRRKP